MASASAPPDPTLLASAPAESAEPTATGHFPKVLAGRYELHGLLGSGGMGTVYRARDLELDETVALKVLKKELAAAPGMLDRFRREVKLARKVTHMNVARTFDIGEDGGDRFLTMEYVEGEPLSTLAARERRMPLDRVVAVARAVLEGLAASHDAGVVHGDLKPENVICAKGGRVVITDFGIARALSRDPAAPHTATGTIVGTPAYMAPEQVEGVADLDGRADLYALGCMLFRLLTGETPWTGSSWVTTAAARLLSEPPDPRAHVADLPEGVRRAILRCMARDRDARFATAREASDALVSALASADTVEISSSRLELPPSTTSAPGGGTKTVAVLPVHNHGPEEDAYLAGGLGDDLIDMLSAVPRLRVRPRGAVAAYAGADRDAREAGRALGVDVVVEGSVRRAGDVLRATLRLLTVEDGFQLWARRFDRAANAFFAIGDEASAEIAGVLASEKLAAPREGPSDPLALDLYLRGRFVYRRSYYDAGQAVALLRAAHERAPRDARIASAFALALMRQYHVDLLRNEVVDDARALAEAALATDPSAAEAHVALALIHLADRSPVSAARALAAALAVSPSSAEARYWAGSLLLEAGPLPSAIRQLELARAGDPTLVLADTILARAHALSGDWEALDAVCERLTPDRTDPLLPWLVRARLALWRDDRAHAARLLEEVRSVPLPELGRARIVALLEVARDRALSQELQVQLENELRPVRGARRSALNAQIRIELLACAGAHAEALPAYASLEDAAFIDVVWLDHCPALASLRGTKEHEALRRTSAARAERVREALERAIKA